MQNGAAEYPSQTTPLCAHNEVGLTIPDDPLPVTGISVPQQSRWLHPRPAVLLALLSISALVVSAVTAILIRSRGSPLLPFTEHNVASADLRSSPLTSAAGESTSPAFSPDGRQIAFVWDGTDRLRSDVYVQLVGGDLPLRLTYNKTDDGVPLHPQWSPDGRQIAFTRCNGNHDGVYTIPALGGPERRLSDAKCANCAAGRATWTPDAKSMLMIDRCTKGGPRRAVLFSFATGEKHCLAGSGQPDENDMDNVLSPDGQTVAFLRATETADSALYTVPVSGGAPRLVVAAGQNIMDLMWTPDSRSIVFSSNRGNIVRTWRVPAAGGQPMPELVYPAVGALSRDGSKLAYTERQNGERAAIWRADLSGPGGQVLRHRKLIYSQFMEDTAQPSPDGASLALQSARSGNPEIWLNSAEGGHPVQLTSLGTYSGTPRWSPDGRWIAFDSWTRKNANIYVVDSAGRNLHAITKDDSLNVVSSWSRDGKSIYYASKRTGSFQIWKHSLEDGSEKRMTSDGGFDPFESYDGQTIYYSRRDEAGIWSMPAAGGSESPLIQGKPQRTYWGHWAVTQDGLYLLNADPKPRPAIEFYSFATRRITPVLSLEKSPSAWQPSLSASRDGRTLYYSQLDAQSSITLVDNLPLEARP